MHTHSSVFVYRFVTTMARRYLCCGLLVSNHTSTIRYRIKRVAALRVNHMDEGTLLGVHGRRFKCKSPIFRHLYIFYLDTWTRTWKDLMAKTFTGRKGS